MVSGQASQEKLLHFCCGECQKWWSIGDAPARTLWYCPWCGVRQVFTEIVVMDNQVKESAVSDAMAAADEKVVKEGLTVGSRWRHFKHGDIYVVSDNVVFEEDTDVLVIYHNERTPFRKRARRLAVFTDIHPEHKVKRFEQIE